MEILNPIFEKQPLSGFLLQPELYQRTAIKSFASEVQTASTITETPSGTTVTDAFGSSSMLSAIARAALRDGAHFMLRCSTISLGTDVTIMTVKSMRTLAPKSAGLFPQVKG